MTKPIAVLRFVHDIESGWYVLEEPDGDMSVWCWHESAKFHCEDSGWDIVYDGDPWYKPNDIPMKDE